MAKHIDLVGKAVGSWQVLEKLGPIKGRGLHTYYKCVCKCGTEKLIASTNLVEGTTSSCNSCAKIGIFRQRLSAVFSRVKSRAEARGIKFSINHNYVLKLMNEQEWKCAITKLPLEVKWSISDKGNSISSKSTASLDRIDSKKGYIKGNVQWVYKPVNMMKWKLTQKEFIEICRLVAKNNPETL